MSYLHATEQDLADFQVAWGSKYGIPAGLSDVQRTKAQVQRAWAKLPLAALKYVLAAVEQGRVNGAVYVEFDVSDAETLPCGCIKGLGATALVGQEVAHAAYLEELAGYTHLGWYTKVLSQVGLPTNPRRIEERFIFELEVGHTPRNSTLARIVARWLDEIITHKERNV